MKIAGVLIFIGLFSYACQNKESTSSQKETSATTDKNAFISKLQPAPVNGGFRMDGYWVWGGSPIRGEDGMYHLSVSRWKKDMPFYIGYVFQSEVVRAVAEKPEGPYEFAEVVLEKRGLITGMA